MLKFYVRGSVGHRSGLVGWIDGKQFVATRGFPKYDGPKNKIVYEDEKGNGYTFSEFVNKISSFKVINIEDVRRPDWDAIRTSYSEGD